MSKLIVSMATLSSGGAERVLSILSKPLAEKFDVVIYVMWVYAPVFYKIDSRVHQIIIPIEIGSNNEFKRMFWFRHFVKNEKPDLILSFLEPWNIRVLLSTIGNRNKIVVAERNDPRSVNKYWLVSLFEKLVYLRANKILVQTETIRKFFKGRLFSRTSVIFNPVNISEELVGRALTTPKRKRIVSVARLTSQKKHDMLIRAFARFNQTHPDYTLTIYGNGPQQKELQDLAVKLRVGDKVKMPGAIKAVHHEILNAEMFCLVSLREGMSNAMIEAMCLGLPCICTKVSGAIDLIEHNKNGILIDIDDENALYEQMCRLATDRQLSEKLGKEASRLYGVLRIDVISKQWTNYLNSLL